MPTLPHVAIRCLFLFACLIMASCQKAAEPRYSASLERAALMRLVFPTWQTYGPDMNQTVDLSATTNAIKGINTAAIRAQVSPLYVVKLDAQHAALITQVLRIDENGLTLTCHMCGGEIGAYFFEHSDAGWRLSSRQDSLASSGNSGHLGKTDIFKLRDGQFAVTAESEYCGQGYCSSGLAVVGITTTRATQLSPFIVMSADNDGAYGACSALDKPKPVESDAVEDDHECLDIQSQWKFQGDRLLVSFEGRLSLLDKNERRMPTQKINQQLVYDVTPNELKLVSGSNPIPRF
jgi:hypothetical protein